MTGVSDDILWHRTRAGDSEAFALIFERHAKAIYNFSFRRTGDWEAAADIVSIVFLEAWRRRDVPLSDNKVLPWLYGIATNVVRNRRRAERRYAGALRRVAEASAGQTFTDETNSKLDDERHMQVALRLVSRLPRRERDVFVLCDWLELSYEDAAFALGTPVGTVRSRLSRARSRLRELEPGSRHEEVTAAST